MSQPPSTPIQDLSDGPFIRVSVHEAWLRGLPVKELKELLKARLAQQPRDIRIVLAGVEGMDSSAIATLLYFAHTLKPKGITVRLEAVGPRLREQLHLLVLDSLILETPGPKGAPPP